MASTYKITELIEGDYQVIGKSNAYVTKYGTTCILSVRDFNTNIESQVWANAYLMEYIENNKIPAGGFKITIKKDITYKNIVDIPNFSIIF